MTLMAFRMRLERDDGLMMGGIEKGVSFLIGSFSEVFRILLG